MTELPQVVASPADDGTRSSERACVSVPHAHVDCVADTFYLERRGRAGLRSGALARARVYAQLAETVSAPAKNFASTCDDAHGVFSRRNVYELLAGIAALATRAGLNGVACVAARAAVVVAGHHVAAGSRGVGRSGFPHTGIDARIACHIPDAADRRDQERPHQSVHGRARYHQLRAKPARSFRALQAVLAKARQCSATRRLCPTRNAMASQISPSRPRRSRWRPPCEGPC